MDTDTVTDTMALLKTNLRLLSVVSGLSILSTGQAAEITIKPRIGADINYTDNVNLSAVDEKSSWVGVISPGVNIAATGNNGELMLDYSGSQTFVTEDSDKNDYWNTLALTSWLGIKDTGFRLVGSSNITQVPRNTANQASADFISGEVVERRSSSIGFQYSNDKKGLYDLRWDADYSDTSSEDDIGDYDGYETNIRFSDGRGVRKWFWDVDYRYSKENSSVNSDDLEQQAFDAQVGYRFNKNTAFFVKYYDEDRNLTSSSNQSFNSSEYGPGVRWYFTNTSYAEATYNISLDDEVNDDYVGGSVVWIPSARTELRAEYNKRFFGDNYVLFFRHRIKRLQNSIRYDESLESFDRSFFQGEVVGLYACPSDQSIDDVSQCYVNVGDVISPDGTSNYLGFSRQNQVFDDQFSLDKSLTWNTDYKLSRTEFNFSVTSTKRENLESFDVDKELRVGSKVKYKLGRKTSASLSYEWRRLTFDEDTELEQVDYYNRYSVSLMHEVSDEVDAELGARYTDKRSNVISNQYDESRVFLKLTKRF